MKKGNYITKDEYANALDFARITSRRHINMGTFQNSISLDKYKYGNKGRKGNRSTRKSRKITPSCIRYNYTLVIIKRNKTNCNKCFFYKLLLQIIIKIFDFILIVKTIL